MGLRSKGSFSSVSFTRYTTPDIPYAHELAFADLNNDGAMDFILFGGAFPGRSENIARPAYVFTDNGNQYQMSVLAGHASVHSSDYEFADFNGDGYLDLYVGASGYDDGEAAGEQNFLYLQANGAMAAASSNLPNLIDFVHGTASGDLDGDGDLDLVANAQYGNNKTSPYALINDGQGLFILSTDVMPASSVGTDTYQHERYHWLGLVDVNGDGLSDLVTGRERPGLTQPDARNKIFINTGQGFTDQAVIELPEHPEVGSNGLLTEILGGDIDGDGDRDLIMAGHTAEPYGGNWYLQVLENDGSGHFTDVSGTSVEGAISGSGIWMSNLSFRDINGDGLADIVVESYQGGATPYDVPLAWLGNGEGLFSVLLVSDVVPEDQQWLAGLSSLVWNGKTLSLVSVQSDANSTNVYEIEANSIPQVDFAARARGDVYRDLATSETIDAGDGCDTFIVSGSKASVTVQETETLLTLSSNGRVDRLSNFERLHFDDGALAFDREGIAGQAYRLYKAALDRTPDTAGLGYWIDAMDKGVSLESAASGFLYSAEFQSLYGANPTNDDFLTALYNNVLDRSPDGDGYLWWLNELESGARGRAEVLVGFSESAENQVNVAGGIANGIAYDIWGG